MADNSKTVIFKNHLKELMHEKYITKAQFCRDIDISKPTLDKWLNIDNDILPTLANTLRIAEKYNVSIDWLTGNQVIQEDSKKNEDIDIVKKTFEAIIFLDEHFEIELSNKIDFNPNNDNGFISNLAFEFVTKTITEIKFTQMSVYYFIQEYKKIQKIVNDTAYADYKDSIINKLFEKFKDFAYSKDYKSIYLSDKFLFGYDHRNDEIIITQTEDKGTSSNDIDELSDPF